MPLDLFGLFAILAIGLAAGWAALTLSTAWMLTHPPRRGYAWAVSRGRPGDPSEVVAAGSPRGFEFTSWTVTSRGRGLPVWDITGLDPNGPTVILTHGWGDSRVVALSRLPAVAASARRVVMWDLPGHDDAPGRCSLGAREADDLRALLAAIDDASPPSPLILYGSSLGAGLSLELGAELGRRLSGVIAEAPYRLPFTPARNVLALRGLPWRANLPPAIAAVGFLAGRGLSWWPNNSGTAGGFDRTLSAARLTAPLLVLHGTADPVCPIADGRAIALAAPTGRIVEIPDGRHNDLWTDSRHAETCAEAVRVFAQKARAASLNAQSANESAPI